MTGLCTLISFFPPFVFNPLFIRKSNYTSAPHQKSNLLSVHIPLFREYTGYCMALSHKKSYCMIFYNFSQN
jgi:hypothetical protein